MTEICIPIILMAIAFGLWLYVKNATKEDE
jgi:hypothetical protein